MSQDARDYDERLGLEVRYVDLPGKQVRQAKLDAWARSEGVRIIEQRRLVSRTPLRVCVAVVKDKESAR